MNWILQIGKDLVQAFTDPYRPELHYMRGPGPSGGPNIRPGIRRLEPVARLQKPTRLGS
jgi:hypothetical protein